MILVQLAPNSLRAVITERHERNGRSSKNLYFLKAITQFRTTISLPLFPTSYFSEEALKRPQLGNRPIIHL